MELIFHHRETQRNTNRRIDMKWTRTPLANRSRYTSGEFTIDVIQKGFSDRLQFYVVKRHGKTVDMCDTLREAKEAAELEADVCASTGS
jgi:hypothetical protein